MRQSPQSVHERGGILSTCSHGAAEARIHARDRPARARRRECRCCSGAMSDVLGQRAHKVRLCGTGHAAAGGPCVTVDSDGTYWRNAPLGEALQ